jgi:hypothetical protein
MKRSLVIGCAGLIATAFASAGLYLATHSPAFAQGGELQVTGQFTGPGRSGTIFRVVDPQTKVVCYVGNINPMLSCVKQ